MKTRVTLLFVFCATCHLAGCGSSDSNPSGGEVSASGGGDSSPAASGGDLATGSAQTNANKGGADPSKKRRPNERWTDKNGVQYLGNVPLDVFFDQPLQVASNATPLDGMPVASFPVVDSMSSSQPKASMNSKTAAPEVVMSAAKADDWTEMLPAKNLLDEVNQIRNFLNSSLQSVGAYNSAMLSIPGKAAALAALAEVASNHPEEISWKEDAAYIRNLAKKMTESTLQRGKKDQSRLLLLFENVADILNRSRPSGLEEPSADDSFSDVAEMGLLMLRMAESQRRMKSEAGSESAFGSKKEMVKHEAMILASLTKIIAKEEYGYGDDAEFVGYAQKVMDACETIRDSADTGTYSAYELALSKISTNCQECHSVYKNN